MNRAREVLGDAVSVMREQLSAVTGQSERTIMLGLILLMSALSAVTGYILTQCYAVDVLSSFLFTPQDCWLDWATNIGRHCFGDYAMVASTGTRPNPWDYPTFLPPHYQPFLLPYPAAGFIPHLVFGIPAHWLGAPRLGLIGYMVALTIAVISPAAWAARGTNGLERAVVFVALSAAAIPAWAVIDRGNSAGFVVPIALVLLVALRRQRWGLVTVMVVLAALVKPQFAVLGIALLAARQWRWGGLAFISIAISNIAAYLLWPRYFPGTIGQSIHSIVTFNNSFAGLQDQRNLSFARALLLIPDNVKAYQTGGKIPDGFLAGPRSLLGYAVLVLIVVSILALGQRIPPFMVGIVLLATATLFPAFANFYYLIFVLPVAAFVARDPDGPPGTGIFDRLANQGGRRRAVGICVSLAVALSIAQIALPIQQMSAPIYAQLGAQGIIGTTPIVATTVVLTPFLWLVTCAVVIISYARRPASSAANDLGAAQDEPQDAVVDISGPIREPLRQRPT